MSPIHQTHPDSWRFPLLLIAAITLWRLAIAAVLPVTQDEAYYFDWARHLAWGYFDHPPGVALLGLGTRLEPGSAVLARLGGLLAGTLTLLVLARFYRHCGLVDRRDLTLALMLACMTLPGLAGGVIVTPDTVLALAWALALHESERALAGARRRWLTAGIAVGLGLLGKYTMILIGPILLWAILRTDWRALRTPWPYLGALLALLVFMPNILWNAEHDWLTMRFQFGHGFSTALGSLPAAAIDHAGPQSVDERLASLLEYLATQAGCWGLILPLLLFAPWLKPPHRSGRSEIAPVSEPAVADAPHAHRLLIAATGFPLGFFAFVATFSAVEANWPMMSLLAAAPLAARWLQRVRFWAFLAATGNLLLVTLYVWHALLPLPLSDRQNRILRETHGFAELARIASELDAPVYADRYQTTAMLRFYQPALNAHQWPGLTRPSEYLREPLARDADSATGGGAFWLVTRFGAPPAIDGFGVAAQRTLFDCPFEPLRETLVSPCQHPLHTWHLYRYLPAR